MVPLLGEERAASWFLEEILHGALEEEEEEEMESFINGFLKEEE